MLDPIGDIIDRYDKLPKLDPRAATGGDLYELMKELKIAMPKAMETFKSQFTPPRRATQYLSQYQAGQYGIPIPKDWQVKILPVDDPYGNPHFNLVMPDGWEVTDYNTYVAPTGERYTEEQYLALPKWDIPYQREYLINRLTVTDNMPVTERMRAEYEQIAFIEEIKQYDRTPELESLLKELFDASDLDIDAIFHKETFKDWVDLYEQGKDKAETTYDVENVLMGFPNPFQSVEWKDDIGASIFSPMWFWNRASALRETDSFNLKQINKGLGEMLVPDFLQDATTYFWSGVGNVIRGMAWTADWKEQPDMAAALRDFADTEAFAERDPDMSLRGWRVVQDPHFYTQMLPNLLPYTMAMLPLALAAVPAVGALGLGTAATVIIAAIGGGVLQSGFEGAMEGGQTYQTVIERGGTHAEADAAADEVFWKNAKMLIGSNAAQIGVGLARFTPVGGRAVGLLVKLLFEAGSEAGEELLQDIFQRQATGQKIELDYQMQEAIMVGGIMGLGFGGIMDAMGDVINKTVEKIPNEAFPKYEEAYLAAKDEGKSEMLANLSGLDKIAPKHLKPAVNDAVEEATRLQAQKQLDKMGVNEFIIPPTEEIMKSEFAQNMFKRAEQLVAEIKPIKKLIETTLGTRELTTLEDQTIEAIVSRNAIVLHSIRKQGRDLAAAETWIMRKDILNPVKEFGFNKVGFSQKMQDLLLPQYEKHREIAGTLEHIFTHHEMYNLTDKQISYIVRVRSVFKRLLAMKIREGAAPKSLVLGEYIHRVVTGRIVDGEFIEKRGGKGGGRLGAEPSAHKKRSYKTQAEGIADGTAYSPNPEEAVSTAITDDYKHVADVRFAAEIAQYGETPLEQLIEKYPEMEKMFKESKKEADLAKELARVVQVAAAGGVVPNNQLIKLERQFPVIIRKLKSLTGYRLDVSLALKNRNNFLGFIIKKQRESLKDLHSQGKKVKESQITIADIAKEMLRQKEGKPVTKTGIPQAQYLPKQYTEALQKAKDEAFRYNQIINGMKAEMDKLAEQRPIEMTDEAKVKEALHLLDWQQQVAFRHAMEGYIAELQQQEFEMKAESEVAREVLRDDLIYNWRGFKKYETKPLTKKEIAAGKKKAKIVYGRTVTLYDILMGRGKERKGIPEYITIKDAKALLDVDVIAPHHLDKTGKRAKWEYIIDQIYEFDSHIHGMYPNENAFLHGIENTWSLMQNEAQSDANIDEINNAIKEVEQLASWLADKQESYSEKHYKEIEQASVSPPEPETTALAEEKELPAPIEGEPEAGLQKDMWGYYEEVRPKGKGKVTQISMDEYQRLQKLWKDSGQTGTPSNIGYELDPTGLTSIDNINYYKDEDLDQFAMPEDKAADIKRQLKDINYQVNQLKDMKKLEYEMARSKRSQKMEEIRAGGMKLVTLPEGEHGAKGYIAQPMFGGKMYNQDFIDAINQFFGHEKGSPTLKFFADAAGILRITKAAFDASALAIQGATTFGLAHSQMLVNPAQGLKLMGGVYKAFGHSLGAFLDMGFAARYMADNEGMVLERIRSGGSSQAIDYFQTLQEQTGLGGFANKLISKLPLQAFQRAETSFFIGAEICRDETWKAMYNKAEKNGQLRELATFLDRMTGVIDTSAMSVPQKMRQFEAAFMWFAPRYTRACSVVLADVFRGGMTGSMARKSIGGLMFALAMYTTGFTAAQGFLNDEDEESIQRRVMENFGISRDPITGETVWSPSARIMSFNIGNSHFGLGGFFYGMLRLFGKVLDCVNEVGDNETIDLLKITKYGSLNRDNPFISWWYSRSSPLVSVFREALYPLFKSAVKGELQVGRTYMGTPIETPAEYGYYLASRFVPIWIEQGIMPYMGKYMEKWLPNIAREYDMPSGMAKWITPAAEFLGMRVFADGEWVKFYEVSEEVINKLPKEWFKQYYEEDEMALMLEAQERGELTYKQLTKFAKQDLLESNKELKLLYEYAVEASNMQHSEAWKAYNARIEEERDYRNTRLQRAEDDWKAGIITPFEYRERCKDIMSIYSHGYEQIQNDSAYKEVFDYFDRLEERGTKYEWWADMALQEYEDIIYDDALYDELTDTFDWEERDRMMALWIDKYGMVKYEKIQEYRTNKKEAQGYPELYTLHKTDTELLGREYWELPYQALYKMTEQDFIDGKVPHEYEMLVRTYMSQSSEASQESFLRGHPELTQDFKAEYRAANPEHDAMLKLWGYGGDLQSMEAYEICMKRAKELGFTDEALLKMQLPPQAYAATDFGYKELSLKYNGNSAEAKLYRLDHADWATNWANEAYGWIDLEGENVNALRIKVQFREEAVAYDLLLNDEDREKYLIENDDYWTGRLTLAAYSNEVPEEYISGYVEYGKMPVKGHDQERFLMENPDYYENVWLNPDVLNRKAIDFERIHPVEYDELYQANIEYFEAYQAITTTQGRTQYLLDNKDFARVKYRYDAYEKSIPEQYLDTYVDYFMIVPKSEDEWFKNNPKYYNSVSYYEEEWFMQQNMDYYTEVWLGELGRSPISFEKIPTRQIFELYKGYLTKDLGSDRLNYRALYPEFDRWLLAAGKVSKLVGDRGIPKESTSPWDIIDKAKEILENII